MLLAQCRRGGGVGDGPGIWNSPVPSDGGVLDVPNHEVRMVFNWTLGRRTPQGLEAQTESFAARAKSEPADVASLRSQPSFGGKGS